MSIQGMDIEKIPSLGGIFYDYTFLISSYILQNMNKKSATLIGTLLIVMGAFLGFVIYVENTNIPFSQFAQNANSLEAVNQLNKNTKTKIQEPKKITTIAFVGDIMLDRGVKGSVNKNFAGDYNQLFKNAGELKDYDILFGNLEGAVSNTGNNVGSIYSFRMNPVVMGVLKDAGFDIVSFANNHVGDWNVAGFKDTLVRLDTAGIQHTGAGLNKVESEKVTIIEKNGIKFGFVGFSDVGPNWIQAKEKTPGILLASDPKLPDIIKTAKEQCDVLIVSFHWGTEYQKIHNIRQEKLAHTAIDTGADMVIGHHPHVVQDIRLYKEKPIVYSLGNFIFDQYFSKDTMQGMMYVVTFEDKKIIETSQKTVQLNKFFQIESIK